MRDFRAFFTTISWRMCRSRLRSATSRFSLLFSSRSWRRWREFAQLQVFGFGSIIDNLEDASVTSTIYAARRHCLSAYDWSGRSTRAHRRTAGCEIDEVRCHFCSPEYVRQLEFELSSLAKWSFSYQFHCEAVHGVCFRPQVSVIHLWSSRLGGFS